MLKEEILNDRNKTRILARIIAHLMGDGCVTNRYAAYFNKNQTLLNIFEKDILNLFRGVHIIKGTSNSGTSILQIQNKEILTFLKELLGDFRSNYLIFPDFINTKKLQKEFLRSLYDDEGCVALRTFRKTNEIKRNLTLSSNSKRLLNEIKQILRKDFDISSNKIIKYIKLRDSKTYTNYILSITGKDNFIKFRNQIGFSHTEKSRKLDLMLDSYIRK